MKSRRRNVGLMKIIAGKKGFSLVSFLYERDWRQSFNILGSFPGAEKEFELIKDYLNPIFGGNIVDASCESGLSSRLFAKSALFLLLFPWTFQTLCCSSVLSSLSRTKTFLKSTVDVVQAGGAVHCWPSPSAAVVEISRVLRPRAVFVATTKLYYFLLGGILVQQFFNFDRPTVRRI